MKHIHSLRVASPNGDPACTRIFLDDQPLNGVVRMEFAVDACDPECLVRVKLEMYVGEITVDAELVEREFVSPEREPAE